MLLIPALSLNSRLLYLVAVAGILTISAWFMLTTLYVPHRIRAPNILSKPKLPPPTTHHPIDDLIATANTEYDQLLAQETHTLHDAAESYRQRRGRHPPPGFDAWHAFAQNSSALIIESFFDQIYHDLAPFWGVPAQQIREQANDFIHRISVRDGVVTQRTDVDSRPWLDLWEDLVKSVVEGTEGAVPDVDLAINEMDESRVVVPWEEIDGYMRKEREGRKVVPVGELKKRGFRSLRGLEKTPPPKFEPGFEGRGPYWGLAVVGCPPESPARKAYIENEFTSPPPLPEGFPEHSYEGYVQNWTLAKSPCENPQLQGLHGTFVEPISISTTKTFFPLFGGSKLPMNNEILLPPAMYWTKDPFYSGGNEHGGEWEGKKDGLIWRGAASGGRNREENWTRFQRHRFVSMANGTSVSLAERQNQTSDSQTLPSPPPNFRLPTHNPYNLVSLATNRLGAWIASWSDAAIVHLLCFPGSGKTHCPYTDSYYAVAPAMPMKEQYAYKYLPDIDGNSFSGRYRGFLGSTSLPLKATIYDEWHDSRLVPWKHFVPMDNTFADFWGVMEYFLGDEAEGLGGRDAMAERIAMDGKAWAERVLRREDMMVFSYRLLLEYARLCDDEREFLGWAGDLKGESGGEDVRT
ncbi:hypothetical protein MBLNU230_g3180t1 [Neophaeotheca triangularis]